MNPLSILKSLIAAFHDDDDPSHLAAGLALGAALGLIPKGNLIAASFVLIFFFFRLDKGLALLSAAAFTAVGYGLDGVAHRIGRDLLLSGKLRPLWTWLYNLPIVPWTKFNNTVVLGNLVIGVMLFFPLYAVSKQLVLGYRARWRDKVQRLRVVQAVKGLSFVQNYLEWKKSLR